ncbi:MAG: PLDc N-terminal domain-containing protein [Saprospiraceae bacterium]|nr:PLDc N-terminal domain-containing protein [Saprospiraceae bacterium]
MGALFGLMFVMIGLGFMVLWVVTLVEIIRSDFPGKNDRLIYLLMVILAPVVGTVIYLMVCRKHRLTASSEML